MTAYRSDAPPTGVLVIVWYYTAEIAAAWDGHAWHDEAGRRLAGNVWYWRER